MEMDDVSSVGSGLEVLYVSFIELTAVLEVLLSRNRFD